MIDNISKFDGAKVLLKMVKPKTSMSVWFIPEKNDPFIINVIYFKPSNGKITYECQIIEPDIKTKIGFCERAGFKILNNDP